MFINKISQKRREKKIHFSSNMDFCYTSTRILVIHVGSQWRLEFAVGQFSNSTMNYWCMWFMYLQQLIRPPRLLHGGCYKIEGDKYESLESLESGQLSCGPQHILLTLDSIVNNAISYPNHVLLLLYVLLFRKHMGK